MKQTYLILFLCLSASTATSDFTILATPISSFRHDTQQIRIWPSALNTQLAKSQWQFRYDPIFSPVVNESGQILIETERFTEKDWRTSFVVNLDDETVRSASFSHLQRIYNNTGNFHPENVFALAVSSLTVTIPDILDNYLTTTLVGKKLCPTKSACYTNTQSSFRIQFSSPSQAIANEIERVIPISVIYYEMSTAARLNSSSEALFTYKNLKASPFYETLRGRANITYVSRNELQKILLDSLWGALTGTMKDKKGTKVGYAKTLLSDLSTQNFDEKSWALTYKSNLMRPSSLSVELAKMFTYDSEYDFYLKNPAYQSNGEGYDVSTEESIDTEWTVDGLKKLLKGKGIDADISRGEITVKSIDMVRINWPDSDQQNSVYLDPISGFLDLGSWTLIGSPQVSIQIQKRQKEFETMVIRTNNVWSEKLVNISETMNNIEELVKRHTKLAKNSADVKPCYFPWLTNCAKTACFCYLLVNSSFTWGEANSNCRSMGAELASIHSVEENDFIAQMRDNAGYTEDGFWIGLNNRATEATVNWTDGTTVDYSNWHPEQPKASLRNKNDCARLFGKSSFILDLDCNSERLSVCKKLVTYL